MAIIQPAGPRASKGAPAAGPTIKALAKVARQPAAISHQPSAISHQPSAISVAGDHVFEVENFQLKAVHPPEVGQ
jgi:hypothetical protein